MKDRYDNTLYILRKIFIFVFTVEGAVIYIYYRMYVFILQKKNFCCCYSYNSVKVLESRRKSWESTGTLMQKVLQEVKKRPGKSWKVLEFESISKTSHVENKIKLPEVYKHRKTKSWRGTWKNTFSIGCFQKKSTPCLLVLHRLQGHACGIHQLKTV